MRSRPLLLLALSVAIVAVVLLAVWSAAWGGETLRASLPARVLGTLAALCTTPASRLGTALPEHVLLLQVPRVNVVVWLTATRGTAVGAVPATLLALDDAGCPAAAELGWVWAAPRRYRQRTTRVPAARLQLGGVFTSGRMEATLQHSGAASLHFVPLTAPTYTAALPRATTTQLPKPRAAAASLLQLPLGSRPPTWLVALLPYLWTAAAQPAPAALQLGPQPHPLLQGSADCGLAPAPTALLLPPHLPLPVLAVPQPALLAHSMRRPLTRLPSEPPLEAQLSVAWASATPPTSAGAATLAAAFGTSPLRPRRATGVLPLRTGSPDDPAAAAATAATAATATATCVRLWHAMAASTPPNVPEALVLVELVRTLPRASPLRRSPVLHLRPPTADLPAADCVPVLDAVTVQLPPPTHHHTATTTAVRSSTSSTSSTSSSSTSSSTSSTSSSTSSTSSTSNSSTSSTSTSTSTSSSNSRASLSPLCT